jgi:hypothetical protein
MVDQDQDIATEHGMVGGFHQLMMQSLLVAIIDQLLHQLEAVVDVGRGVQKS